MTHVDGDHVVFPQRYVILYVVQKAPGKKTEQGEITRFIQPPGECVSSYYKE